MNLYNFQDYIDERILERGYDYYLERRISQTVKQGDRDYRLTVEGSESYQVQVEFDDQGEITRTDCDCPYDMGPICKHQVAGFYWLLEIMEDGEKQGLKIEDQKSFLRETLDNLPKEELIQIIVELAEKNESLANKLILRYSKGNSKEELKKVKKLMDSIVQNYRGWGGYIEYMKTDAFCSEMEELLDIANETADQSLAMDIAAMFLIEAVKAFEYVDDSDGGVGQLVTVAIDSIETIVTTNESTNESTNVTLRSELFGKLLELVDESVFDGWEEFSIDLLSIAVGFADIENFRERLYQKIEEKIDKCSGSDYQRYSVEALLRILLELKKRYGTKEEEEAFIKENIDYKSFRESLIDRYFREKDYQGVIDLALAGEKKDQHLAGLVSNWKRIRYRAYKALGWQEQQLKLAKELFLSGDFNYYQEMKDLSSGQEAKLYQSLKQETKASKNWQTKNLYLRLIDEADDLAAIMDYVRENPYTIENHAAKLKKDFYEEVIVLYQSHIKRTAEGAKNRRDYQGVCAMIKRYKKIAGQKNQALIIEELTVMYKRKPAFMNELKSVKN